MAQLPDFGLQFKTIISITVIAVFLAALLVEIRFPLRQRKRSKSERYLINLSVSGLALATGGYVVAPVALALVSWTSETSFGLLRAEVAVGFLLMDLTFYYWHRANHSIRVLWRFHNVHHVDPDLDVSTSFLFHFVEVLYSVAFRGASGHAARHLSLYVSRV